MFDNKMQAALNEAVNKVVPINGISFPDLKNENTWKINYIDGTSDADKDLAKKTMDSFVWTPEEEKKHDKAARNEMYAGQLIYKWGYFLYQKENPAASFSDYLDFMEKLDVKPIPVIEPVEEPVNVDTNI